MPGNRAVLKIDIDQLRHTVRLYGPRVVRDALRAMQHTVEATGQRATAAAPEASGDLKASIKGTVRSDGYTVIGRVRVGVKYAQHLEFGTEKVKQHPHLVPAAIDERKHLQDHLTASIVSLAPEGLGKPRIVEREQPLPAMDIEA